jgi:hypothetical protein
MFIYFTGDWCLLVAFSNLKMLISLPFLLSESRLSLLISGIICLNLLKNKIFQIKI